MLSDRSRRQFLASLAAATGGVVAGCLDSTSEIEPVDAPYDLSVSHEVTDWEAYDPEWDAPTTSPHDAAFEIEPVIEHLDIPWDIAVAADESLFFSERVGRISRYDAGTIEAVTEPADVIDHAASFDHPGFEWWGGGSEGGLLGIALHPTYPDVPLLYAFYTYLAEEREDDDIYRNRLVFYDLQNDYDETVVIDAIPGHRIIHNGARLAFGPRNYLWVTTGDAGDGALAQDPSSLAGKILRLKPDGTPPADNPGFDDPRIHTMGHRNPQAISWLPDGTPIAAEHGDQARDEVNILEPGGNYGWPDVRGGPGDTDYGTYPDHSEVTPPVVNTGPSTTWAPPGGVFYTGDDVPALQHRFVLGGLISQQLNVITVTADALPDIGGTRFDADWLYDDYDAVAHALFTNDLGRIRHVTQGPRGELYAVTSNRDGRSDKPTEDAFPTPTDDRLVRIRQV